MLKIIFLFQKGTSGSLCLHTRFCVSTPVSWAAHRKAVVEVLGSETDFSGLEATEDKPLPHGLERQMLPVSLNYLRER